MRTVEIDREPRGKRNFYILDSTFFYFDEGTNREGNKGGCYSIEFITKLTVNRGGKERRPRCTREARIIYALIMRQARFITGNKHCRADSEIDRGSVNKSTER